ncbi:MAG TPA: LytTR family DNA-binding domain-containing protein [Mycobacteriales bacterium]|nr:LytTR family DNA-binding domain-containing protein [Mycobacteriales bacterium]
MHPRPAPASGLRLLLADADAAARVALATVLAERDEVAVVEQVADGLTALRRTRDERFAGIFLAARLPGLDGVELARLLRRFAEPPPVVLTAATPETAVDAFDVRAVDFLLTPVPPARVADTIARLCERLPAAEANDALTDLPVVAVDTGARTLFVDRGEVSRVEACGGYSRLHTLSGHSHLVRLSLDALERAWGPAGFVRVHRAHLIAVRFVSELRATVGGGHVVVVGGHELPVSRRHLRQLRSRLLPGAVRSSRAGGR